VYLKGSVRRYVTQKRHKKSSISEMFFFLVGFSGEDSFGAPWPTTAMDPRIVKESVNLGKHDATLKDSIVRGFAADMGGSTGVYTELKTNDWAADTVGGKTIPVILNNGT
jgi:hypothetical protein